MLDLVKLSNFSLCCKRLSHPGYLEGNNVFENFFPGGNKLNSSKSLDEMLAAIFSSYNSS